MMGLFLCPREGGSLRWLVIHPPKSYMRVCLEIDILDKFRYLPLLSFLLYVIPKMTKQHPIGMYTKLFPIKDAIKNVIPAMK